MSVLEELFPAIPGLEDYRRVIQQIANESNLALIQIVEDLSYVFSQMEDLIPGPLITRIATPKVRTALWEIQERRCFYCLDRITSPDSGEVDHFIPWARYPDNDIHNFVAADSRCNGNKRDFLAASAHVKNWVTRFDIGGSLSLDLKTIAEGELWEQHPERTIGVARATYLHLPGGAKLWITRKDFEDANPTVLGHVLGA
jgi:hypothetical protein